VWLQGQALRIFDTEEGGAHQCQDYPTLVCTTVADWQLEKLK
jgi:hypothetical protein